MEHKKAEPKLRMVLGKGIIMPTRKKILKRAYNQ